MAISDAQKKLRTWFQRHGWHTNNTSTGWGFWLNSPVENNAGLMYKDINPETGEKQEYCKEKCLGVELDRFDCKYVSFIIYERKHWWKKDPTAKNDMTEYTTVPSDEFGEWKGIPSASISIPAKDIVKMAELILAAQKEYKEEFPDRNPNDLNRETNSCIPRWIGVNSSYEEIENIYSNERLRKKNKETERG
jgi:hypothetical protein